MKQPTERAGEAAMCSRSAGVGDVEAVYVKIAKRIIPFLALLFVMAWLDRYNLGFAKLQMVKDLGFSQAVYGFGAASFTSATCSSRFRATSSLKGLALALLSVLFGCSCSPATQQKGSQSRVVSEDRCGYTRYRSSPGLGCLGEETYRRPHEWLPV